jgi:hypothetical protein
MAMHALRKLHRKMSARMRSCVFAPVIDRRVDNERVAERAAAAQRPTGPATLRTPNDQRRNRRLDAQ